MYRVLHTGFDTLDIAFAGAFPKETLAILQNAKETAEHYNREQAVRIGPANIKMLVSASGMKGGYRYVMTNGPSGAIFAVKANADTREWNLFVSLRALRLLTLGYDGAKQWLFDTLADIGFAITDHSVNRLDYAIDISAPGFELDIESFVCPSRMKARLHWSKDRLIDDDGNAPQSVVRGRQFESVTVGRMPNRQVILYDKRRAAIDLKQPYWFDVWDIDRNDPSLSVWRVEIRAGRDALNKKLLRRHFDAVEAYIREYLTTAAQDIRYVDRRHMQANVSRVPDHPLWSTAREALHDLPLNDPPPLTEKDVLEAIRQQRLEMAEKQFGGNLINALVLAGTAPEDIAADLPSMAKRAAHRYFWNLGPSSVAQRTKNTHARLSATGLIPELES